jgi:hypothetical protein
LQTPTTGHIRTSQGFSSVTKLIRAQTARS